MIPQLFSLGALLYFGHYTTVGIIFLWELVFCIMYRSQRGVWPWDPKSE